MIEAYWARRQYVLRSTLYILNADMGPYHIKPDGGLEDSLHQIANYIQTIGIETLYVDSPTDLELFPKLKEILVANYSYNKDFKMEVKI